MRIAVDFDGVICRRAGIPRKKSIFDDPPQDDALEAVKWLMESGHELYIFSNRDEDDILIWLKQNNFPLLEITNRKKPNTSIYLDDRAIRFTSWLDFTKYVG